ncbi:unnamed protein product [Laminaria digitata]
MECAPGRCPTLRGSAKHCLNNAIQTRSFPSTEIFRTFEGRGWGLRLSDEKGAKAGTLLHEYLGQVIGMDECRKRLRKVGRKGVEGSSSDFYFASLDGNLVLDAGPMGSEARFANHSCAPNCILQKWSVLGETRVVLVAAKDISYAEELTYNYQADTLEGFVERQKCLCGEPQCSGFIGGELVAVKADEWRRRTSKVMGQAKPQLGLVRELFNEGRDLGLEETGEADYRFRLWTISRNEDGGVCYRGREMECLSLMLKEGDDWLAQLAEVLEGAPDKPTTGPSPPPSPQRRDSKVASAADACCANGVIGRRGGGTCDGEGGRRTRSRGASHAVDGSGSKTVEGEGEGKTDAPVPCLVDLMSLERVLLKAPPGLQMLEATKAKKTATRAGYVARTVWALLDAASKHGLDVLVPEQRALLVHSVKPATTKNGSVRSSSHHYKGKGRASETGRRNGAGGATAVAAPVWAKRKGGAGGGGGGENAAIGWETADWNGARRNGGSDEKGAESGGDGMALGAEGVTKGQPGDDADAGADAGVDAAGDGDVDADAAGAGAGAGSAGIDSGGVDDDGSAGTDSGRGVDGDGADNRSTAVLSEARSEPHDESTLASVGTARSSEGGDSSMDDAGSSGTENGVSTRVAPCPEVAAVTVTTRSGGKKHVSALIAEGGQLIAPQPPTPVVGESGESSALPPKPKMSQVYQAIRSCRGLAPVLIPGASELLKLVASAEAWASKACEILKIKIQANTVSETDATVKEKKDTGAPSKEAVESKDGSKEKEKTRWAKLGLESSAISALEEKLQEVAEFSLAREQREEELEKERLLKEKEDTKEREKQARLDKVAKFKCLAKRRRPRGRREGGVSGGGGSVVERGNAAGNDTGDGFGAGEFSGWEARRSPRCVSSADADGADACASVAGTPADPTTGNKVDGWRPEDEDALHCLCRLPADTARFRTLMKCDLCHSWFHPACVRLKEVREGQGNSQGNSQALAFACPMCEHARGGVSNFACPPSPGFYIGRRMHRPGLAELEPLVAHAERLPVDGVDGQDYLSYMVKQVVDWSGRCHATVKEVQGYIQGGSDTGGLQMCVPGMARRESGGEAAEQANVQASSLTPAGGLPSNSTHRDSHLQPAGEGAGISEQCLADSRNDAHAGLKEVAMVSSPMPAAPGTVACSAAGDAAALSGIDRAPVSLTECHETESGNGAGLVTQGAAAAAPAAPGVAESQDFSQQAVSRRAAEGAIPAEANPAFVASEVCATPVGFSEGAVKEREDGAGVRGGGEAGEASTDEGEASPLSPVGVVLPSIGRDLVFEAGLMERLGRLVCEGALIEVVDVHKEDVMMRRALWMLSASLAYPSAAASLRAGQETGLAETLSVQDQEVLRSSGLSPDYPTRLRPTFETLEASLTEGRTLGLSRHKGKDKSKSRRGLGSHGGAGLTEPPLGPGGLAAPALVDTRPTSEPLGAGARVYGSLFDVVGDIIQAVVKAEAKPFREARMFLPVLRTATRWAAIEPSWGFARALASELFWLRETGERASTAEIAADAPPPPPEAALPAAAGPLPPSAEAAEAAATPPETAAAAAAPRLGATGPEEGAYCICRGGDDGGVMVLCDACSEWFHAPCVGLTARVADGLKEYYCIVCCGSQPEKYGHYAHSWVTNVAVEAAVRRVAPKKAHTVSAATKRKNKRASPAQSSEEAETSLHGGEGSIRPSRSGEAGENNQTGCMTTGASAGGIPVAPGRGTHKRQRVASARLAEAAADAAEMVSTTLVVPSKRLRHKGRRGSDPPGAKRARATAWVASYVERHYAELGVRWPPERPSWTEETREDPDGPLLDDGGNLLDDRGDDAVAAAAAATAAGGAAGAAGAATVEEVPPGLAASQSVAHESIVGASHEGYASPVRSPSLAEILASKPPAEKEGVGDYSSLPTGAAREGFVGQPGTTCGAGTEDNTSSFALMFKHVNREPFSREQQQQDVRRNYQSESFSRERPQQQDGLNREPFWSGQQQQDVRQSDQSDTFSREQPQQQDARGSDEGDFTGV